MTEEQWHLVEAKREGDELPTVFRIRDLAPRPELAKIYVIELPYPVTDTSKLPGPAAYRRLGIFEERWLVPACQALGLELVAIKTANGSLHAYLYGGVDPAAIVARLAPFDGDLGFYDDDDPAWGEYAALQELLVEAKAMRDKPRAATRAKKRASTIVETTKPRKRARRK